MLAVALRVGRTGPVCSRGFHTPLLFWSALRILGGKACFVPSQSPSPPVDRAQAFLKLNGAAKKVVAANRMGLNKKEN